MNNYDATCNAGSARTALMLAVATVLGSQVTPAGAAEIGGAMLEEVLVTATRREEALSKVPVSVAALSQDQMDMRGLKEIDGLARFTPGLVISRLSNGLNNISIRGISSGAGAGTTGVYIDDTPIQARNLAYSSSTAFPMLFDLERVEVLRGPQGTLFGAGSEGGTVRFIQTQPNLDEISSYARGEFSSTDGGDPSYEVGVAFGAPLVAGRVGFRMSAFYREDGGYIDGVSGTPVIVDPSGDAGPASLDFTDVQVRRKNTNSASTTGFRGALKFLVTDGLEVTPSVTYQKSERNDGYDTFWPALSGGGRYARPVFDAAPATAGSRFTALTSPDKDKGTDEFYLPALQIDWDLGPVALVSNTSYFDRESEQFFDFTQYYLWFYAQTPDAYPRPGDKASSRYFNTQQNFVQEVRLQSTDRSSRFSWVAGAFYSNSKQRGTQAIGENFLGRSPMVGLFFLPPFLHAVDDGDPFGPGSSAYRNWFGVEQPADSVLWSIDFRAKDTQLALFAETEFRLTERLKLITGVRVSRNELDFGADYDSPENNLTAPFGAPGPVEPPFYSSVLVNTRETATTPRVGLSFEADDRNLFYTTAAKGFRPPGASQRLPLGCNQDLIDYGYVDGSGEPLQPLRYSSDSVWSYEVGSKNRLFGDRLVLDGSIYRIEWKDIQTGVFLPSCAESFVTNIAEATSEGFDLGVQIYPLRGLSLLANVGYNRSRFGSDGLSPGGVAIVTEDAYVPGSPAPWVSSASAQYDFRMFDAYDAFVRADVTHSSKARRIGQTDPNSPNYNEDLASVPAYSVVSARIGMDVLGVQLALFANNLTNESPDLALANSSALTGLNRYLWTNQTIRPRTFGLTLTYRY